MNKRGNGCGFGRSDATGCGIRAKMEWLDACGTRQCSGRARGIGNGFGYGCGAGEGDTSVISQRNEVNGSGYDDGSGFGHGTTETGSGYDDGTGRN